MPAGRTTPVLPDLASVQLQVSMHHCTMGAAARGDAPTEFYMNLRECKAKNWSMRTLADALDTSHEMVRRALVAARELEFKPHKVTIDIEDRKSGPPPKPEPVRISKRDREAIRKLVPLARDVNGSTPIDERTYSEELTRLLAHWYEKGASRSELVDATDGSISWRGIRMRLSRHGHMTLPPSQLAYVGRSTTDSFVDENWDCGLTRIDEWIAEHGDANVPLEATYRQFNLGRFCELCQHRASKGSLSEEQVTALTERGLL